MAGTYEDIDNLMSKQNEMIDTQRGLQDTIVDKGLQKAQNEVDYQKKQIEEDAQKQGKALYVDYKKQANPYGATAEQLASQGLNKSGYAEATQANLYNSYQRNLTSLMTNVTKLKAEADFNMNQAYIDADIQKAQNSLALYQQQANLLMQEYDLRYHKYRDDVADSQWERQFAFQQQQAALSQSNWERQYALSLRQ
jgi:hypothetical protein